MAFSLPVQFYFLDDEETLIFLDPRLLLSRGNSKNELTGVVHAQTGVFEGEFGVIPGVAVGLAVGKDIDVNALRLEAGYNILGQITLGLGFQFLSGQRSNSRQQVRTPSDE